MSRLRLLISESFDPWFNLAVEETIFRQMPADQRVMFLWRNADTVVIGRAQNPWKECNTRRMEEDNVRLARRSSGGGAVFQDLGNTCFTFMAGKPEYDKSISTKIIVDGLARVGINAEVSGRNDLVLNTDDGPRKISGSAYRETRDRGFHHGTLLINSDLNRLADYLNPDPKKLQAKGITSVRSRVTNLCELVSDISHEKVCEGIVKSFSIIMVKPLRLNLSHLRNYRTYRIFVKLLRSKVVGNGISVKHLLLPIIVIHVSHGEVSNFILISKKGLLNVANFLRTVLTHPH